MPFTVSIIICTTHLLSELQRQPSSFLVRVSVSLVPIFSPLCLLTFSAYISSVDLAMSAAALETVLFSWKAQQQRRWSALTGEQRQFLRKTIVSSLLLPTSLHP